VRQLPAPPKGLHPYIHELHATLEKVLQQQRLPLPTTGTGAKPYFEIEEAERAAGVTPTFYNHMPFDGRRYNISAANSIAQNNTGLQQLIDVIDANGGGTGVLPAGIIQYDTDLVFPSDGMFLVGAGGDRGITSPRGTVLKYFGSGVAFKGDAAHSCGLSKMLLWNGGSGTTGLHIFDGSDWLCQNLKIREFDNDNLLVECDTSESTIYNTFIGLAAFKADGTAIGARFVEGAAKATNNNAFINADFGSNLVGIQQDDEVHDNVFLVVELGGCVTGAIIRGRTTLEGANIENTDIGIDLISGAAGSVSGSLHFQNNATADINNPDNRPIFASMQGGGASNSIGFNARNTGQGFRGQEPPTSGGLNFSTTDGSPVLQRADVDHIALMSGYFEAKVPSRAVQLTTTARDALTPQNGFLIYNTTTGKFQGYQGGAWVDLA
jgi:hypothetical protein